MPLASCGENRRQTNEVTDQQGLVPARDRCRSDLPLLGHLAADLRGGSLGHDQGGRTDSMVGRALDDDSPHPLEKVLEEVQKQENLH